MIVEGKTMRVQEKTILVQGKTMDGKVMDIQGPSGFILTISVLTFLFLMVSLYRTIRR